MVSSSIMKVMRTQNYEESRAQERGQEERGGQEETDLICIQQTHSNWFKPRRSIYCKVTDILMQSMRADRVKK